MSAFFCPGRIEVLGKHTDYAGGHSLVCAIDRGTTVEATASATGRWSATSEGFEPVDDLLGADLPAGHWANYPRAAVRRLLANFGELEPLALRVSSDLPPASGMSSSSALLVASALSIVTECGLDADPRWLEQVTTPEDLATYLACIENGADFGTLTGDSGVGTFGGSEDHTAMVCSEPGLLGLFRYCPTELVARIPLPSGLSFVVADSGVAAEKTGAARDDYNNASALARELLVRWNRLTGREDASLGVALRSAPDAAAVFGQSLADEEVLRRRLAHFVEESEVIVPQAADALATGALDEFGELVGRSQTFAELALGNQVPATIDLATSARTLGALASTSFGAGYGGSVWALVPTADADSFADEWLRAHLVRHPDLERATTFVVRPGSAAHRVDLA